MVDAAERLRRDVRWADVLMPDGDLQRGVRVFVTDRRLIAYGRAPQGGLVKRVDVELPDGGASVERSRVPQLGAGQRLEVQTAAGVVYVNRAAGCDCTSPTKYMAQIGEW